MSFFIVLALLVVLTKSLISLAASEIGLKLVAVVVAAGLLSYMCRLGRTAGKSFDCSRQGGSVAEGHIETIDRLQQDIDVSPARQAIPGSSLVRRLVRAKDDPPKQRIRLQLSEIDDEGLFSLGLTPEDIAMLRGTSGAPAETIIASQISPSIAGPLEPTDTPERDPPRRERVLHVPSG
jgi:hypothetical protein